GFPPSTELPSVAPVVLRSGAVRIVEVFSGATIEWSRTRRKDWVGQFLYANSAGAPGGAVRALADPAGGTWRAWTELFPAFGARRIVRGTERRRVHAVRHGHRRKRRRRRALARDAGGRGAPYHRPAGSRRHVRTHGHAAVGAAHVSRRLPRRERAAALVARAE